MSACNAVSLVETDRLKDVVRCLLGTRSIAYKLAGERTSLPVTFTDERNSTWGLDTKDVDASSLIGIIIAHSDRFRLAGLRYSPTVCWKSTVAMSSDKIMQIVNDCDESCIIFDISKYRNASQQIAPATKQVEAAEELPSYPMAEFIRPTENAWNEDLFVAEEAVRTYLKDPDADH